MEGQAPVAVALVSEPPSSEPGTEHASGFSFSSEKDAELTESPVAAATESAPAASTENDQPSCAPHEGAPPQETRVDSEGAPPEPPADRLAADPAPAEEETESTMVTDQLPETATDSTKVPDADDKREADKPQADDKADTPPVLDHGSPRSMLSNASSMAPSESSSGMMGTLWH